MKYLLTIFLLSIFLIGINADSQGEECLKRCMKIANKTKKHCLKICTKNPEHRIGSEYFVYPNQINQNDQDNQYRKFGYQGQDDQYRQYGYQEQDNQLRLFGQNELDNQYRQNQLNSQLRLFGQNELDNQYRLKGRDSNADKRYCYDTCMQHAHQSHEYCIHVCYEQRL